ADAVVPGRDGDRRRLRLRIPLHRPFRARLPRGVRRASFGDGPALELISQKLRMAQGGYMLISPAAHTIAAMAALAAGDEVLPRKRTMPVLDGGDSQPCTTSRTSAPESSSSCTAAFVAPRTVSVVSATVLSMP